MKKMIAAILLFSTTAASAEVTSMAGAGVSTCAEFAKAYREFPNSTEDIFLSWAQGYLSAVNMVRYLNGTESLTIFASTKGETIANDIWQHVRNYCDQHPLKDFADAVVSIN